MKVLVTGADGQVGTEMVRLADDGFRVAGLTRRDLDITDRDAIARRLDEYEPDFLVNCAAYTAVDRAEDEPDLAVHVNADAVGWLGEACDIRGVGVIHFSTDYVFDGTKDGAYVEDDTPNPLNVYGASKLAGENRLRETTDRHVILRVSWVFGRIGRSFVDTILRLAGERDELTVVDDQVGAPSPADAVAATVRSIVEHPRGLADAWGTYHFCSVPTVSWCGFAREILAIRSEVCSLRLPSLRAVTSEQWGAKAPRPRNSQLDSSKLTNAFVISPTYWRPHLRRYIAAGIEVPRS
ncbi:MAG: dTDP-4-dehydrorhamnose reductase [Gammaproteobacteria bacterium]|nr:dTDP-4-dehydrorhamnose reductase [Gammaproteobacteria bacterium]